MKRCLCLLPVLLLSAVAGATDWKPMFDGTSLKGWQGATDGYYASNGLLVCTMKGGNLFTDREYSDFEMEFDFKLTAGANNGLGVRTTRSGDAAYAGMELQILDDGDPQYAKLHEYQYHGSIYGVVAAKRGHQKPVGEWNHERVICIGDHVKVELNGVTITDAHLDGMQPADGKQHPGLHNKKGLISFCGHNANLQFRDLRIKDYSLDPAVAAKGPNVPPEGFEAQFNGTDLANWKGLVADPPKRARMTPEQLAVAQKIADDSMRAHWRVEGGEIVFDGKGQSLCTAKDHGDFDFMVDWKIPKNGDSGIYLRGSPQIQIWDTENTKDKKNGNDMGSGALWNNQKSGNRPLVKADKPVGEWNTFLIRMVGEKVTVYLNGKLVLDNVTMENYWERAKPIYDTGSIELQNHGGPLWFRNVFVRDLPR